MPNKIILTLGLPGSGKTTWALAQLAEDPSIVRVNRDEIRKMTTNQYWTSDPKRYEPLVTVIEDGAVQAAIQGGFDVIVDATNLNPKTIARWHENAARWGATVELKTFETGVEECVRRDQERYEKTGERLVGRTVIERMANDFVGSSVEKTSV